MKISKLPHCEHKLQWQPGHGGDAETIGTKAHHLLYLGVMRAHRACAFLRAPWVALMRIGVRVIFNFIIPRLDVESWRPIPEGAKTV